jgi:wyosine [tRNA(Phe)-imidazoG37] synthetase (radical SAM superfamily)
MNQLIIIFEFEEEDSERANELRNRIREYKSFAFTTSSSCVIWTNSTAPEVRDHLKTSLKTGDKIFVSVVASPAAWLTTVSQDVTDYLKKNLK